VRLRVGADLQRRGSQRLLVHRRRGAPAAHAGARGGQQALEQRRRRDDRRRRRRQRRAAAVGAARAVRRPQGAAAAQPRRQHRLEAAPRLEQPAGCERASALRARSPMMLEAVARPALSASADATWIFMVIGYVQA